MTDQFHKGLNNIHAAIDSALREHEIDAAAVSYNGAGEQRSDTAFTLTVNGKSEVQTFTRQEIEDSGQAIDHTAAVKVRLLVSPFVR